MAYRLSRLIAPRFLGNMARAMSSDVSFQQFGRVGRITLDRPKALNALNGGMVGDITERLIEWRDSDELDVVCIEGAGEKAFCVGGDVVSITRDADSDSVPLDFFYKEFQMNHMIGNYPKTYVALIHGITMGGGVGLSVHGKFRVATERSLYAMPETAIGYFPDVGGSYFLSRLPQPYGIFLGLTGHRLKGSDLKHLGIATHFTLSENLPALKSDIMSSDRNSIADILEKHDSETVAPFSLDPHDDMIKSCFSDAPSVSEIISRLKRHSNSDLAPKLLAALARMSPRSLVVTHKLLTLAPSMTYDECFAMEFNAAQECVRSGEFREGVRALLVDKDHAPQWNPSSVEEVTQDVLARYFVKKEPCWKPLDL